MHRLKIIIAKLIIHFISRQSAQAEGSLVLKQHEQIQSSTRILCTFNSAEQETTLH